MATLKIDVILDDNAAAQKLGQIENAVVKVETAATKTSTAMASAATHSSSALSRMSTAALDFLKTAGAVYGGLLIDKGINTLISWGREAFKSAGILSDLAAKSGLTASMLQRLDFVGMQAGVSMERFADASFQLGVRLGQGKKGVVGAVAELGLNFEALKSMSPDQQLHTVLKALSEMRDEQDRNRIGVELFGKQFKAISAAVTADYAKMADAAHTASDEQIRALDDTADAWDRWVKNRKADIMSFFGGWALARERVSALTPEQMAQYQALVKGGGDSQGFLQDIADANRAAGSVKPDMVLPSGAKPPQKPPKTDEQLEAEAREAERRAEERRKAEELHQKALDKLSGREAVKVAQEWVENVKEISKISKLSAEDHHRYNDALGEALDAMSRLGIWDETIFQEWLRTALPPVRSGLSGLPSIPGTPIGIPQIPAFPIPEIPVTEGLGGLVLPGENVGIPQIPQMSRMSQWANALASLRGIGPGWMQAGMNQVVGTLDFLDSKGYQNLSLMDKIGGLAGGAFQLAGLFGQEYTSTGSQVGSGAMSGLQMGAMFGPWGAAIGAGIGAIVGLISGLMKSHGERAMAEIGREWGVQISKELAEQIEADMKRFGNQRNNRWAAEVFNLGAIIQEAGGITDDNFAPLMKQLRQAFNFLHDGVFDAKQVGKVLDESFGAFVQHMEEGSGIASKELLDIIHLTKQWGVESKAVTEYLKDQAGKIAGGFNKIAQNFLGLGFTTAQIAAGPSPDQLSSFLNGGNLDTVGALAQGTLGALLGSGVSLVDALAQMGPGLDAVVQLLARATMAAPTAFRDVQQLQAIVTELEQLVATLGGVDEMLKGLHNSGLLTNETFAGLSGLVTQAFDKLVAGGVSADQALRLMQPQLQTIWQLQKDFGYVVDEGTQALINQGVQAGIVGAQMKPVQEQTLDVMKQTRDVVIILAETLGAKIPEALRGLPSAAQEAATGINDAFSNIKTPRIGIEVDGPKYGPNEYDGRELDVPQAARGGFVPARRGGTIINVGEGGEGEYIIPASRIGGGGGLTLNITVEGSLITESQLGDAVTGVITAKARELGLA